MAALRMGQYGEYYGSHYDESAYLTQEEREINAAYIYKYLSVEGWTVNAIAALLGNMQTESTINPGCWQSHKIGNMKGGYSLTQWTPATKYIDWCGSDYPDPSEMDAALARIIWEHDNVEQFYKSKSYPITFKQFAVSTKAPSWLAEAFLMNYEKPASVSYNPDDETYEEHLQKKAAALKQRGDQANRWYEYLTGLPAPVVPGKVKRKGLPLLLMWAATRRKA